MLSVAEARARMLAAVSPTPHQRLSIEQCCGRTLAAPVVAARDQPPFPASAMDGYAIRTTDTPGRLRLIGEAAAGRAFTGRVGPGMAVRISTGAPVPDGADTILIQEDATRDGDWIDAPLQGSGRHIRAAGNDFSAGAELLAAGRRLDSGALTLAAGAGCAILDVHAAPRVTIFSGGDEIVLPGAAPAPDQIYDSTRYGVAAMIAEAGAAPRLTPLMADNRAEVRSAVGAALESADLIVLIGGASVGEHDHARAAVRELGAELAVEKVAIRPGKPTWFGLCRGVPVLGLPGNPASALVCARVFLAPLLAKMTGRDPADSIAPRAAKLRAALTANGPRETYLRGRTSIDGAGQLWVEAAQDQDSSLMRVFAESDCLIARTPDEPARAPGEVAAALPL